ncbi:Fucose 4-O-acetylase [Noviherbaspirillum humi]|uniref:Fucose 4-O-acetylase n=1 Tax=Noviherbaspirillum humi TaxID=1688639 RepID=A0A239C548_9BURK|nr:acyltransferase family protein [Noviherbaspirillum humi]SNS14544.1 Fucose 4-O-acetylase [Noviherbaspirillum humi]
MQPDAPAFVRPAPSGRAMLDAAQQLKGLGIMLVVAAHLVKYQTLGEPLWYSVFKFKVYLFHMPLLMFVSGYLFFHTGAHENQGKDLRHYLRRRANRLLVPFFAIAFISLAAKLLLRSRLYVDEAPAGWKEALLSLLVNTEQSPVQTVWFLLALFVFCCVTPALYRRLENNRLLLLVFAACLYPLPVPDIAFANRLTGFYLFFAAGAVAQSWRYLELPSARHALPLMLLFLTLLALPFNRLVGLPVCGLLACLALPRLLPLLGAMALRLLAFCGRHSMAIYLLNVMAVGVAKAAFLRVAAYQPWQFVPLLLVTFTAGLFGPVLVKWLLGLSPRTCILHRYLS